MTARARAHLDVELARSVTQFASVAEASGLPHERSGSGLRVDARLGRIELSAAETEAGTALQLTAGDDAELQMLRDMVGERIAAAGLSCRWLDTAGAGRPANLSVATVERAERLSPSYTRVTLTGPDLARFDGPGLHLRLLFGPDGSGLPTLDEAGLTSWPGGIGAWHRPVYTTRSLDPLGESAARLVFDVFRHDGGRVTSWTDRVRAGDEIALAGPMGGKAPPRSGWIGLVGDETAVPVIARILEALPLDTAGCATLFVPEAADIQQIHHPPRLELRWRLRGGADTPRAAFEALEIPREDRFCFFAAERQEALAIRAHLADLGLPRDAYHAAAYWSADPQG